MESIIAKLDENDWKYFANEDLQNAKNKIEELNKQKAQTQDTEIIKGLNNEIENAKVEKEIAEYRLKKDFKDIDKKEFTEILNKKIDLKYKKHKKRKKR